MHFQIVATSSMQRYILIVGRGAAILRRAGFGVNTPLRPCWWCSTSDNDGAGVQSLWLGTRFNLIGTQDIYPLRPATGQIDIPERKGRAAEFNRL